MRPPVSLYVRQLHAPRVSKGRAEAAELRGDGVPLRLAAHRVMLTPLPPAARRWFAVQDTLGGYALTLVDTLDTIALMGARRSEGAGPRCVAG